MGPKMTVTQQAGEIPRRDFLYVATGTAAAVGTIATLWPFIDSMNPSADVRFQSSIELALGEIEPGQRVTVKWRGRPVFVDRRTPATIERARADDNADLRDPQTDAERAADPEWLIVVGVCTHLGCVPLGQKEGDPRGTWGGWFCPCHGSHYDVSGRIRKGPAPKNLVVPAYQLSADRSLVVIG
jgi:ubiquinol-cytochrome c reductase iron-sulfur subunit